MLPARPHGDGFGGSIIGHRRTITSLPPSCLRRATMGRSIFTSDRRGRSGQHPMLQRTELHNATFLSNNLQAAATRQRLDPVDKSSNTVIRRRSPRKRLPLSLRCDGIQKKQRNRLRQILVGRRCTLPQRRYRQTSASPAPGPTALVLARLALSPADGGRPRYGQRRIAANRWPDRSNDAPNARET